MQRQRREALEVAAGRLALEIERRLHDIAEQLSKGGGISLAAPSDREAPASLFSDAEAAEFQKRALEAAVSAYRQLAESPKANVRAAALVRTGRVHRERADHEGALGAYSSSSN